MRLERMFTPLTIGNVELPNRFAVTAMVCNMCDENGYATEQYIKYHEAKAKGGYGLIITEDYAVNAHAGGYKRVARIYDEDMIPGHKKMVDAVHAYGTKIFCADLSCRTSGKQQCKRWSSNTGSLPNILSLES